MAAVQRTGGVAQRIASVGHRVGEVVRSLGVAVGTGVQVVAQSIGIEPEYCFEVVKI